MGSIERRIRELEEQFSRPALGEEEARLRDRDSPEVVANYDRAVEVFRAALQEAKEANPGVSRVPTTPESEAAHAEMLRARNELREFSRERGGVIGSERKDGGS